MLPSEILVPWHFPPSTARSSRQALYLEAREASSVETYQANDDSPL
jgi:hypothetical protein